MKKILFLSALILSSCAANNEPELSGNDNRNIEFDIYVSKTSAASKAAPLDNESILNVAFGAFACYSTSGFENTTQRYPNVLNNQRVVFDRASGQWIYSPMAEWTGNTGKNMAFLAYAPFSETANYNAENATIEFEVKNNPAEQVDLLWDSTFGTQNAYGQYIKAPVTFAFRHALAAINFRACAYCGNSSEAKRSDVDKNTIVIINQITLSGADDSDVFYQKGFLNISNMFDQAVWLNCSGRQSFRIACNEQITGTVNEQPTPLSDKGLGLFIIPQNFAIDNEIKVTVNYTVRTLDTNLPDGYIDISNASSATFACNFQNGKNYDILINLNLNSLTFNVDVVDWDDGPTYDIIVK